jgi:diaminohydroxyphosphoribosylaminopyrimidine deaminase / 5-amino-6-(5-phosphoribosylamino)uracil reductase
MSTPSSTKRIFNDNYWMFDAMELARDGMALAHPNPRVGAVVVSDGLDLGHGFHRYDQLDHAEIVALKKAGAKARGASLYVNLEPCCTTGRTGPCTEAIIGAGIKKVYAVTQDPNPAVAGRGFAKLRRTGLPFVTLKTALTLDGKIAARSGSTTWITSEDSREAVQRLRHAADALLTGIGTVLADDPRMTDRTGKPRRRKLLRAIIDSRLRLPLKSNLVKSADGDVAVFTVQPLDSPKALALLEAGVAVVRVPAKRGHVDPRAVLRNLGKHQVLNVILEAGAELNGAALEAGIVDKMILFYAPKIMGTGGVPMASIPSKWFPKSPALTNITVNRYGPDFCVQGYFHDVYGNHRARRKN